MKRLLCFFLHLWGPLIWEIFNIRLWPSRLGLVTHGMITSLAFGFQSNVGITFGVRDEVGRFWLILQSTMNRRMKKPCWERSLTICVMHVNSQDSGFQGNWRLRKGNSSPHVRKGGRHRSGNTRVISGRLWGLWKDLKLSKMLRPHIFRETGPCSYYRDMAKGQPPEHPVEVRARFVSCEVTLTFRASPIPF